MFASRCWSLWSISVFQLIGWNSSLLLLEIYADGSFQRAEPSPGWLINTGRQERQRSSSRTSEWIILQMNSERRQVTETSCQQRWRGGEDGEEVLRARRAGAGTPKASLRYESVSKSKSPPTRANKRHVPTEVRELLFPELFFLCK